MKTFETSRVQAEQLEQSDYRDLRVFAASTNEDHTVPANARFCVVLTDVDTWIKPGGSATVPAADVTDGTSQIFVKAGVQRVIRLLAGTAVIATLGIIPAAAGKVSLEFFK